MPFYFFVWDGENERHLAEHGVTMEEFAEVVCDPDRLERSRSSGRPIAFGYTSMGSTWPASTSFSTTTRFTPLAPTSPRNEPW